MPNVIILAGGKGERLRPYTEERPKSMISVLGNPLLSLQLRWLRQHGFDRVTICCGYLHEVIQNHFGDGSKYQMRIEYLIEKEPLGRGGALKQGLKHIQSTNEPVLALNGDIITNLNLQEVLKFHKAQNRMATIVSTPLVCQYGIIDIADDTCVKTFSEKPELPYWINAGIYILNPKIVDALPDRGDHEQETFPALAMQEQLSAYKTKCFWKAVDTVKDLNQVRTDIEQLVLNNFFQPVVQ